MAGDAACVQRLESQAASTTEVSNAFPVGYGDWENLFVQRQSNVALKGSIYGDHALGGSDVQVARDVATFREQNCGGLSAAACDQLSQNALDTRKLRAAALGAAGAAIPLIANAGKGLGSIGKPGGAAKRDAVVEGKPRTLTDDMLAEADFAGRIPTRADLEHHLINAKVSGRQISGGHNMNNFESTLQGVNGRIISKTEIAPGIYEVEYKLPKGENHDPRTKTVYDPAITVTRK